MNVRRKLGLLAKEVFGPSATVSVGRQDHYEPFDHEPERLFTIDVGTSSPRCSIEMVGPERPSAHRRQRLMAAMVAALEAQKSAKDPDFAGWHEAHDTFPRDDHAHRLGRKNATISTSHVSDDAYGPFGVTFLHGASVPYTRFWGIKHAESAALAIVNALLCPRHRRRLEAAYEKEMARQEASREADRRWRAEHPMQAEARDEAFHCATMGTLSRDVQ
jgi:hypothetical protein